MRGGRAYLQPLPTCSNGESGRAPPDPLQKHRDHNKQIIFLTAPYCLKTLYSAANVLETTFQGCLYWRHATIKIVNKISRLGVRPPSVQLNQTHEENCIRTNVEYMWRRKVNLFIHSYFNDAFHF
jgi:hypothetical protein